MKLVGAAMLRNEADVVESFVRRNLSLLVGLLVVAHGSSDGTSEILDALVAEGLSLEVDRDEGPATNTGRCARTAGVGRLWRKRESTMLWFEARRLSATCSWCWHMTCC
jgi:hypothetical protein